MTGVVLKKTTTEETDCFLLVPLRLIPTKSTTSNPGNSGRGTGYSSTSWVAGGGQSHSTRPESEAVPDQQQAQEVPSNPQTPPNTREARKGL